MTKRLNSKHKVDRRLKVNLWGRPKSPFNTRAYGPGQHGQSRQGKPPDAPQCGFSMAVTNILKILEVNFKAVNVLEDQTLREGIKVFSDWPTIPQLYIKREFVGGCDIIKEMYESGEIKKIFDDKGINYKK